MTKTKGGIHFPVPKGKHGAPLVPGQDAKKQKAMPGAAGGATDQGQHQGTLALAEKRHRRRRDRIGRIAAGCGAARRS